MLALCNLLGALSVAAFEHGVAGGAEALPEPLLVAARQAQRSGLVAPTLLQRLGFDCGAAQVGHFAQRLRGGDQLLATLDFGAAHRLYTLVDAANQRVQALAQQAFIA